MPELEIHPHAEHDADPTGKRVGVQAAIAAVFLAIVTILSHRAHTHAIINKSGSNDQWAYYQATRIKLHEAELGSNLIRLSGAKGDAAEKMLADYESQKKKYDQQSKDNQEKAQHLDEDADYCEHRALRFDIGEGLLEIGLVLTSLYFISRKNMFPVLGLISAIGGITIAAMGFLA